MLKPRPENFGLKHGTRNAEMNLVLSQFTDKQCAWLQAVLQSELQRCQEKELCMSVNHPVFGDLSDDAEEGLDQPEPDFDYEAPVAGRRLGVQSVPRFNLSKLRPFEVMSVDNKDFPCDIIGGFKTAFIFICYKTRAKASVALHRKTENGKAFKRIVARHGIHKLTYPCRVYSDGCGSMKHVEDDASQVGIDHAYIPPHQASLNEAEKVADHMWASARAHKPLTSSLLKQLISPSTVISALPPLPTEDGLLLMRWFVALNLPLPRCMFSTQMLCWCSKIQAQVACCKRPS